MRRVALLASLTMLLLTGTAAAELPVQPEGLRLEKVAMFMRHGIRPPTNQPAAGLADQPWPTWGVPYGNLTDRGATGVMLLGAFDRQFLAARGLLPATGCPADGQIQVQASSKERAIRTARSMVSGLAPGCGITVSHPVDEASDRIYHALGIGGTKLDSAKALAAANTQAPPGGPQAELAMLPNELAIVQRALGQQGPEWCAKKKLPAGCKVTDLPTALVTGSEDGRPELSGPFAVASSVGQSFLMAYLEGKPMQEVGWGRISRDDIEAMLRVHPVMFKYNSRTPYIANRAAAPLMQELTGALKQGTAKLFLICGHDTNIADIGGMLDLRWHVDSYPADDTPPGGGLGFELLRDKANQAFVRVFFRAQTMDQLREQRPLNLTSEPASLSYLPLTACAKGSDKTLCRAEDFFALVDAKLREAETP